MKLLCSFQLHSTPAGAKYLGRKVLSRRIIAVFLNSFGLFVVSHCETSVPGKLVGSKFCRIFSTAVQAGHYGGAAAPQAALLRVPTRVTVPYWIVQPLQFAPSHGLKSTNLLLTIIAGGGTEVIAHLPGANTGMSACFVTWPGTAYTSLLANGLHFRRKVTRASVRPID